MRKVLITLLVMVFAAGVMLAQEKKEKKAGERKISGEILAIDEAKSAITVKKGNDMNVVAFNESTKWTKQEGDKIVDISRSEFKIGSRVICMVKAEEKGQLVARRIDLRPQR